MIVEIPTMMPIHDSIDITKLLYIRFLKIGGI
jgi:hypothetical protein